MIAAVRGELLKLVGLRSTWWLLVLPVAWCALLGRVARGAGQQGGDGGLDVVLPLLPAASMVSLAMLAGSEFSAQRRTSLLATPARARLVAARWLVLAAASAVVALACSAATLGTRQPVTGDDPSLWGLAAHLFCCALVAGLATDATGTPARGAGAALALLWVAPLMLRLAAPRAVDWLPLNASLVWLVHSVDGTRGALIVGVSLAACALLVARVWRRDL